MKMDWKLKWNSTEMDEIDAVYAKAEKDKNIASLLRELETRALEETKANCDSFKIKGKPLTEKDYEKLSENDKEIMIQALGDSGIGPLTQDFGKKILKTKCKDNIADVQACAVFLLLNRLEKIDDILTAVAPTWTLEISVPVGMKQGMAKWEMLVIMLHPWLAVREVAPK